jgi:putative RNA 2'-phosphotransferase
MENKQLSKFLSLVLRHQPQAIGLELDKNGWAELTHHYIITSTHQK